MAGRPAGRRDAAEVDDPLDAGIASREPEGLGRPAVASREVRVGGGLHGVDQVVGGLDALERRGDTTAAQEVGGDGLDALEPGGAPGQGAHGPSLADELADEPPADVSGCPRDELHEGKLRKPRSERTGPRRTCTKREN